MSPASALLLAALLAPPAGEPAFLEVESDRGAYYLGERVPVRVRVLLEERFLRERAVALTLRPVEVPVLVEAPWLRDLRGGGDATLALNDGVVAARRGPDRVLDGTTFRTLVLEGTLRPEKAGDLVLAAPVLRYAHASRFEEDALGTRVALDREEATLEGPALAIRILPLPDAGRPPGFSGGVGRFAAAASADRAEVAAGSPVRVVLRVEGDGDLAALAPPRLDDLTGFHVLGRLDGGDAAARTFAYDLVPLSPEVREVPALALVTFDPTPPAGWRTLRTAAIPLRVLPGPGAAPGEEDRGFHVGPEAILAALVLLAVVLGLARRLGPGRRTAP